MTVFCVVGRDEGPPQLAFRARAAFLRTTTIASALNFNCCPSLLLTRLYPPEYSAPSVIGEGPHLPCHATNIRVNSNVARPFPRDRRALARDRADHLSLPSRHHHLELSTTCYAANALRGVPRTPHALNASPNTPINNGVSGDDYCPPIALAASCHTQVPDASASGVLPTRSLHLKSRLSLSSPA